MGNKVVYACLGLVGLAALVFMLGTVGTVKEWFHADVGTGMAQWSLLGIFVFCGALSCSLPFYEGR
ncbi:MAG: hypothetical protein K8T25_12980 [Planctomycetia bacterium]|nr:hypothetical protein [Planctomycetia bacterium]